MDAPNSVVTPPIQLQCENTYRLHTPKLEGFSVIKCESFMPLMEKIAQLIVTQGIVLDY